MQYDNNATRIRRELLVEIARLVSNGTLQDGVDRVPLEMIPKSRPVRCCIHKDRAVLKYRLMALLGHSIEDETDELKPLRDYAGETLDRESLDGPILTVIDEACSACVHANYFVTNACRGCVARPCTFNCPKNAIDMIDGHAKINEDACVNCGMCMKACPYHAIIFMPVPCEEACPVGAISKDESGKEHIDYDKCIYCGKCLRECPFGAIMERSQMVDVLKHLQSDRPVVAMIAPAVVGQFPADLGQIVAAIQQLGFAEVAEVARGADVTSDHEAAEFVERMEQGDKFMTTSCCPAYVEAGRKHIPGLEKHISSTPTPMHYIAAEVAQRRPDAIKVFIGPCIAKRHEAQNDPVVDYVLTAEELGAMFVAKDIDVAECEPAAVADPARRHGRGFPVSGGVTEAVRAHIGDRCEVKPVLIDGLTRQSLKLLKVYVNGKCPGNLVEVMACEGGCVAGPGTISSVKTSAKQVKKLVDESE